MEVYKKERVPCSVSYRVVVHTEKGIAIDLARYALGYVLQLCAVLCSEEDHAGTLISNDLAETSCLRLERLDEEEQRYTNGTTFFELTNVARIRGQGV